MHHVAVPTARTRLAHEVRRIVQTPRAFSNWGAVLTHMALERVGAGRHDLRFTTRSGLRIDCPNRRGARVPVYEIFAEDCYRLRWFLGPLAQRPLLALDIGGHVGAFACQLADVHPHATIQSYEPSPLTAEFLRRNIGQNGFMDRISVHQTAVAARTGSALFDDNGSGGGTNGLVAPGAGGAPGNAKSVPTVGFDDIAGQAPAPVDLVKIDCEGGEYALVKGSAPESWLSVQRVVLEYHPVPGETWAWLRGWFEAIGLRVEREESSTDRQGTAWLSRESLR